jgi:hypothetical protein
MKRKKTEQYFGVPPEELPICKSNGRDYFITYKSAKKGKISFLVTKALLDNLWETFLKINKQPKLIIDIQTPEYVYILTCDVTKNKVSE